MQSDGLGQAVLKRQVVLGIALFALLISLIIYATGEKTFPPLQATASTQPPLTNPEILQNWLPADSYKYTLARIDDYLNTNNTAVSSMTVRGDVRVWSGTYYFTVLLMPQNKTHDISVTITNYSSIISTAVSIDGQLQYPKVAASTSGIAFAGTDGLISSGFTVSEVTNLKTAFQKFAPNAQSITIKNGTITHKTDINTGSIAYTFSADVDNQSYQAKVVCPDLTSITLTLTNPHTSQQIFDSGTVDSAN